MRVRIAAIIFILCAWTVAVSFRPAAAQDNSSSNPADIGARVRSMVELGSVYTNIYDIAVTVLETVRGEEAMTRLKAADPENDTPANGFEYLLARVEFELYGRAVNDNLPFELGDGPLQWVALASDLTEYPQVTVTVPDPALVGSVNPGDSMEGWVAFAVAVNDSDPVMVFDPDAGGATGRGRTLFFKLHE